MISMTFISIMLIAIALCIMQRSTIYSRGETLRQINQASRTISADLQQTLAESAPFAVNQADLDRGRLCTGAYTYVWSIPEGVTNRYSDSVTTNVNDVVRFARFSDPSRDYCLTNKVLPAKAAATELLPVGDRSLRIRNLRVTPLAKADTTGQSLYVFDILISTQDSTAIDTTSNTCKPPTDMQGDTTYCAVNQLSITVRTGIR
jgi:hypothetical protein